MSFTENADYSWTNDSLWQICICETDFHDFEQPYLGNGILGVRFERLVAGTGEQPLYTLSRTVYDGGQQLLLPAWNHIFLEIGGTAYRPENGVHRLKQILDLRTALVTLVDNWEYSEGKSIEVSVEMFVPRTFGNAAYLSFGVKGLKEEAALKFGILAESSIKRYEMGFSAETFSSERQGSITGDYKTARQKRAVSQVIRWKADGLEKVSHATGEGGVEVLARVAGGSARLELFHTVISAVESEETLSAAVKKAGTLCELGRDRLFAVSCQEWKRLWPQGLAFNPASFDTAKRLLAHQFFLLCSLEVCDYPLSPLGLSKNEWGGNQLWDADFWIFRAILPLWENFAESIVSYRRKTLEQAMEHAAASGWAGAWYPWQTDDEGRTVAPAGYRDELHVNLWIALAAWEYYKVSGSTSWLLEKGWPVISGIADFLGSRTELEGDGFFHLNGILGPDEAVWECGKLRVNDNFLTNYGVKKLMKIAEQAAAELSLGGKSHWREVGENIYLPEPDANGILPEYKGYTGHGIKQADVILAFYPLGYPASPEVISKNIKFYRDKQMYYGPLMSSQIESCLIMARGDKEKGLERLIQGMNEFTRGRHYMPFECRDNDNSVMLTGIGGELQALIYGYYEADLESLDKIPHLSSWID